MPADHVRRRALLACPKTSADAGNLLRSLFSSAPLDQWEAFNADSFAQARFLAQHNLFDVVLIEDELFDREGEQSLGWLAGKTNAPLVFLGNDRPHTLTQAYREGVVMCLPRAMTLQHPRLLEAALERAAQLADNRRHHHITQEQLERSHRQIDRLVRLIWRSTSIQPTGRWFTQRVALERLDEELARAERHGAPFTLAIAEVGGDEVETREGVVPLDEWAAETLARAKRRCDVAGAYGANGFLLLMVHTSQPGGVTCCRRLQRLLQEGTASPEPGPRSRIRACFGLASSSADSKTAPTLLRIAEENLDAARTGADDGVVAS